MLDGMNYINEFLWALWDICKWMRLFWMCVCAFFSALHSYTLKLLLWLLFYHLGFCHTGEGSTSHSHNLIHNLGTSKTSEQHHYHSSYYCLKLLQVGYKSHRNVPQLWCAKRLKMMETWVHVMKCYNSFAMHVARIKTKVKRSH